MADFYHGPWFAFWHAEFLSGTRHLQPDEGWSYFMLLIRAWEKGGIPADDIQRLALISGVTLARMKKIWPRIADKFIPSPHGEGLITNAKLEEVREKAARFAASQSAKARKPRFSPGEATVKPERSTGLAPDEPVRARAIAIDSSAASNLYTNPRERDRARTEENGAVPGGDAGAFAQWFLTAGIASGAIPEHNALDPGVFLLRNLGAAETAIATYGEPECKARAKRFFSAKAARKIRRGATIASLLECWDFEEIKPAPAPSDYMARLKKAGKA